MSLGIFRYAVFDQGLSFDPGTWAGVALGFSTLQTLQLKSGQDVAFWQWPGPLQGGEAKPFGVDWPVQMTCLLICPSFRFAFLEAVPDSHASQDKDKDWPKACGCAQNLESCKTCSKALPQLDAPHLSYFKELLRDRLVANLMGDGQKLSEGEITGLPSLRPETAATAALEELIRGILQCPVDEVSFGKKDASAASMADHAREVGNKCFKERQYAAAVHCYEVAVLLCPSGASCPTEQLATCHCNCALACLHLQRYSDVISECHTALVLVPSLALTVKALQRLAVAHVHLKNYWEAVRCLQTCLDLEHSAPTQKLLEYVRAQMVEETEKLEKLEKDKEKLEKPEAGRLRWSELAVQCTMRDKSRRKKGKRRVPGPSSDDIRQADRDAGLWHSVISHNSKLYIFGGLPDGDSRLEVSGTGSDELHILDLGTMEMRQISKAPHPCFGHSATVVGNSMVVFGVENLMVYDLLLGTWRSQRCTGTPRRQGHSATAVAKSICVFGGLELAEQGIGRVYNDVLMLDTSARDWVWRKLDCTGHAPPARFGHSATLLQEATLLIFGGRDHMTSRRDELLHDHTGLHLLDVSKQMPC